MPRILFGISEKEKVGDLWLSVHWFFGISSHLSQARHVHINIPQLSYSNFQLSKCFRYHLVWCVRCTFYFTTWGCLRPLFWLERILFFWWGEVRAWIPGVIFADTWLCGVFLGIIHINPTVVAEIPSQDATFKVQSVRGVVAVLHRDVVKLQMSGLPGMRR